MRFLRRASGQSQEEAIAGFWRWWAGARERLASAISDGSVETLVDEISGQVRRIHAGLAWGLAPGATAKHAFVASPEGNPSLRPIALAWRAAAPAPDALLEFHASRQPGPLGMLDVSGVVVDLADYRAISGWDEARQRLDVRLWHPALADAPEDVRQRVAYLFLDNLLGEDDVERWIGSIDLLDEPSGGRTPDELRAEVMRRAEAATGESWVLATGEGDRDEALVLVNAAIKQIDYPFCGFHMLVTVERGLEQLAQSGETAELDAAEDRLVEALNTRGAVHVGHVTDRRRRRIHFVCPNPVDARPVAQQWAEAERRFGPRIEIRPDPDWEFRRELGL